MRNGDTRRALLVLLCAIFALPLLAQDKPRSLYDGASVLFESAHLIKPRENTNLGLAFTLAPLIIQEVREMNAPPNPTRVFFQQGSVQLNGRAHVQVMYWWSYGALTKSAETGAPMQGIRVTLNTNDSPVIFEVLGQRGSVSQIFVSQFVEAAALAEFGAVLPGRRFAVERSLSDAPDIVVPRVIDDPPAVMGPIIYLRAGTHEVATLICRCMDSQAKSLAGQSFYELVPAGTSSNTSDATRLAAADPRGLPRDFLFQTNRLSRSLRLPLGF